MLKPQLHNFSSSKTLLQCHKPFFSENVAKPTFSNIKRARSTSGNKNKNNSVRYAARSSTIKSIANYSTTNETTTDVVATVIVQFTVGGFLSNLGWNPLDDISDLFGKSIQLELVAAELDPSTGLEKEPIKGFAHRAGNVDIDDVKYESKFVVPNDFGEIGGIKVENDHHNEMFFKTITLDGFPDGPIHVNCESWVDSHRNNSDHRFFFTNKSYLPSKTPEGLKRYRESELMKKRGDGTGERKNKDRIYDYDVYNDLGNPDKDEKLARPILGGKEHPYPRRCRTGRSRSKKDPLSETRGSSVYVPRDEEFSEVKSLTFSAKTVYSVIHAVIPSLENVAIDADLGFPYFTAIDTLFNEGIDLHEVPKATLTNVLPRLLKTVTDHGKNLILFETPEFLDRDKFKWMKDEEFGRQTLAGLNPCCLQLVKEWPLKSSLDPKVYGPPESAITTKSVEQVIRGWMTVDEAVKQKKLFIIDYHDLLLPYVNKPVAIELVRPPGDGKPQWKEAYAPGIDATTVWLWKLAKAHFLAHDSGFHQLVSHWLRTHCATEPYIIATNRQLSDAHPIYRLLHPYFRYTMEINALARQALINADGIIESSFSPGKYSMEFSSVAYDKLWRFDHQALPADLISRGMAEEDPNAPHGLKLIIEDYPYANDGLILWDCIKQWVADYVNHYYPKPSLVETDEELQAWWEEIRTVGHGDKKDEPWWPNLKTPEDLVGIITTIIWVTSGHHAAVNFGQYDFAAYMPNRPTIARVKMPSEDPTDESWYKFELRPEDELLSTFPTQLQASKVMAVLDVLSNHSIDEEYIGKEPEPAWAENPAIKAAFEHFSGKLMELEGTIDARNNTKELRNRTGAGVVPYQLLKPYSEPGVTGQGVPNSISI
ncbi:Linoleate 13S-lipoxygenase 2-1, chloroplastic [Heracleum sosnowskyi]|uniref:Linoleate 13S-lipoxygenase 2-1, chloroplastic n=1 Tax=Heracleum sosnowskyi TaxID=360622 RepID=A0AAD8IVB6_9APIA|nr:Linoleate 13S-lipoxygenase 2-1, chloroplastic [Heracleum sosnowskyi]